MIKVSLIYFGFTVLLAMVDAIRIKITWGKKENINHRVSYLLASLFTGLATAFTYHLWPTEISTLTILNLFIFSFFAVATCALVRLSVYNIFLNLYRLLTGTNPTGRLDYVSTSTDSKVDTNTVWNRLTFCQQRGVAIFEWALVVFAHYKLHQFHILGL